MIAISLPINYLAGTGLNIQSWTKENAIVIAMLPVVIAPLLFRPRWVQIGAPIVLIVPAGRYSDGVIDRTLRCPG